MKHKQHANKILKEQCIKKQKKIENSDFRERGNGEEMDTNCSNIYIKTEHRFLLFTQCCIHDTNINAPL